MGLVCDMGNPGKVQCLFTYRTRNSSQDLQGTFSMQLILCAHTNTQRSAPDPQLLTPSPANNLKSQHLVLYTPTNVWEKVLLTVPSHQKTTLFPK